MKASFKIFATVLIAAMTVPVMAQEDEALVEAMRAAEARMAEAAQEFEQSRRAVEARGADRAQREVEIEVRMREAEQRLAEAAREVAQLSQRQLPRIERLERIVRLGDGPMLGITIGRDDSSKPVEGVEILGVTPGGAAAEAGLRAGDVITGINGESFTADTGAEANDKLMDFMKGVEDGDTLDVAYLRNGRAETVPVTPRAMSNAFAFRFDGENFTMPDVHVAPHPGGMQDFVFFGTDSGFGDMELVPLTEGLGRYFDSEEGLLVVRAPSDDAYQIQDGDVILSIDGRKPTSVGHAMRILRSYDSGETMELEIMRDRRKRTIEIEVPDNRRSGIGAPMQPLAPLVPGAPLIERKRMTLGTDDDERI